MIRTFARIQLSRLATIRHDSCPAASTASLGKAGIGHHCIPQIPHGSGLDAGREQVDFLGALVNQNTRSCGAFSHRIGACIVLGFILRLPVHITQIQAQTTLRPRVCGFRDIAATGILNIADTIQHRASPVNQRRACNVNRSIQDIALVGHRNSASHIASVLVRNIMDSRIAISVLVRIKEAGVHAVISALLNRLTCAFFSKDIHELNIACIGLQNLKISTRAIGIVNPFVKYSLQGTTQGRYLTGGVPPVRFSM